MTADHHTNPAPSRAEPAERVPAMPDVPEPTTVSWLARRWSLPLICLMVAGLGVLTFIRALDNQFVYDDHAIILDNPTVNVALAPHASGPWYRFWRQPYWPPGVSGDKLYRPLTVWSFWVNIILVDQGRPDARAFHLVNLALHALTCVAVVMLACRLTGRVAAGALAGMLFATHPIHAEAVVTGYGRSELLAGFFAAWLWARYLRSPQPGRPRPLRFHLLNTLLLLAAIMSKEHALFIWPTLVIIDLWHRRRHQWLSRMPIREWFNQVTGPAHVGFALATAAFFVLRFSVFKWVWRMPGSHTRIFDSPMSHVGMIEHMLTPFRLLWLTLVNLVWPTKLCPIWSYPALSPADYLAGDVILGLLLAIALLALTAALWRRRSLSGALLAGMLITLAIPLQALPLTHWFYAERWLYMPTVLTAVLLGAGLARWDRIALALGLALALILVPQSWQYASKFADDLTMHGEVVLRQPDSFHGRKNLAVTLYYQGRYDEAVQAAGQVIERFGAVSDAYWVLLKSYLELGDGRRALEALNTYQYLRRETPEPALLAERRRAEALIAAHEARAAAAVPASTPALPAEPSSNGSGRPPR